jgi:hypothetical protein
MGCGLRGRSSSPYFRNRAGLSTFSWARQASPRSIALLLWLLPRRWHATALHIDFDIGSSESSLILFLTTLRFDQAEELAGVVGEAWENCAQGAVAQVFVDYFAQDAAIVGGDGQVAALI